jgi:hypothetical protein
LALRNRAWIAGLFPRVAGGVVALVGLVVLATQV